MQIVPFQAKTMNIPLSELALIFKIMTQTISPREFHKNFDIAPELRDFSSLTEEGPQVETSLRSGDREGGGGGWRRQSLEISHNFRRGPSFFSIFSKCLLVGRGFADTPKRHLIFCGCSPISTCFHQKFPKKVFDLSIFPADSENRTQFSK